MKKQKNSRHSNGYIDMFKSKKLYQSNVCQKVMEMNTKRDHKEGPTLKKDKKQDHLAFDKEDFLH